MSVIKIPGLESPGLAGWLHPGAIPASDTGLAWSQSERFVDQLNEQVDSQEYNSGKSSCPARGHGSLP